MESAPPETPTRTRSCAVSISDAGKSCARTLLMKGYHGLIIAWVEEVPADGLEPST